MEIGAVLFDMDGLLIDSEPIWEECTDAYCRRRGARYDDEDAAACVGRGIAHSVVYLGAKYGWDVDEGAHVAEILADFVARVPDAPPCAGAEETLRSLHGKLPLALGSSSARHVVDAALGKRGWLRFFDAIVTGSDVQRVKPAPDIWLKCASTLGVEPERCLVLEDSLPGVEAARAARMRVVAIPASRTATTAPLDPFARTADFVARDLTDAIATLCRTTDTPGTRYAV